MNEEIRKRAMEILDIGNTIDDKNNQKSKLENEIKEFIDIRDKWGFQLITKLVDQRSNSIDDLELKENAKEVMRVMSLVNSKIDKISNLENDVDKLQDYRTERAKQLLEEVIDSKNYEIKTEQIQ
jgi:GTP-binding protein EngB required for normal cell division